MVSQFDNVKISYLLHRIIYKTEKDLKSVSKSPTFLQKVQLIKKLLISRVRFARFLVICRWLKYNSHIDKNDSKANSFSYEKTFLEIKKQVKSFQMKTQGNQHYFYNLKQQFIKQYNFCQLAQNFLNKSNNRKKIFQHLCSFLDNYKEVTHIQTIYVIKKYIYIDAYPYYQLIFEIKDHFCSLNRLKLNWDKNLHFSSEYLIQIVSYLNHIDLTRPKELNRIDSFIFSFYIIYFFCKIVKKLMKISKSFNCQILRESNNLVLIIFPSSFQPFNQFILRINPKSNNIEILSKTPLFHPPKDPRTIDEEFEKLDDDIFIPMKIYNCKIDITKKFNGTLFLSELRDLVFYTNVRRFWNFLKREMRSHILPIFKISLKCNFNSIYFISIQFIYKPNILLTIVFQSADGLPIFIPISEHFDLNVQTMFPDAKKIFTSLFIYCECQVDFSYIFKSHALSLMRKFELIDSLKYKINFSFSDNFFIVKNNLILFPDLTLRSVDNPKNLNPRTLLIKQLIKTNKFDQLMADLSITSKIFLILLEIERKLKLKGILSKRILNTICIPTMGCIFKIDLNEYWSICFEKPLIHGVSNGRVIITGNKLSLRFVDSILNIITDWYKFGMLIYIFRHNITYTDDSRMYLQSFGYHFYIIYEPYHYDYFLNANITHCFKVLPFRYPSSHMKVMMYTPFSNYAQYLNNEEDISSYFYCSIYYQQKIIEIFNSKKWKVVHFIGEESFTLIYENQLSMIFHLENDDSHFIVYIFMIGYSSLLLVPLSNLFQIHENRAPVASIKMSFFDLEKVKQEIEKYDDLIKLFKLMKIDHLFFNNGKVIGKGTRFYLVQAVFDLNGIIISSPSFPSLINITTSFYNLKISLESKKKIYNFILSILLFDEKYIVDTLNVLKELVKPNRIQKLNWEEMSNYLKINSTDITLELLIIEDQNKLSLIFDDPINESVLVKKNGREKRFDAKEFDNIYLCLNPELLICNQFDF